jgi:hypothetical protein
VRSHAIRWEDVKDADVIFLASMRFRTLADDLNHTADFSFAPEGDGRVLNRRPGPGETAVYERQLKGEPQIDHAIITVWPGKAPGRRVVVLGGTTTWGTQAAAEFVTRPESLSDLDRRLAACAAGRGKDRHPPWFQVLLRVEIRQTQPLGITFVSHHDLDIPGSDG